MASQTPFILADNVFDRINLYPAGVLSWSASIVGQEGNYAADYRRERTDFQIASAAANQALFMDLGVGNSTIVDTVWLDRGHNLWGKTVEIIGSNDAYSTSNGVFTRVVPAAGTVGGDPTTTWCVTEEGALYAIFAAFPTNRYFRLRITEAWQYIITGVILGKRIQLAGYADVLDEDAGRRNQVQQESKVPGYYGRERVYAQRSLTMNLRTIGATEYDGNIRTIRRILFERDQPAFIVMNYGLKPERGWLYQYDGTDFSFGTPRVYRAGTFRMAELGPLIR